MRTCIQRLATTMVILIGIQGGALVARGAELIAPVDQKAGDQQAEGPGYCWDEYVKEAIAAYDEWDDCHDNRAWYDIMASVTCDFVYEARAIGAAAWWAKCVGMPGRTDA